MFTLSQKGAIPALSQHRGFIYAACVSSLVGEPRLLFCYVLKMILSEIRKTDKPESIESIEFFFFLPQDSLEELEMDDFWKELQNISSSAGGAGRGDGGGETQEEEQQKTPEGRRRGVRRLRNPPPFIKYVVAVAPY